MCAYRPRILRIICAIALPLLLFYGGAHCSEDFLKQQQQQQQEDDAAIPELDLAGRNQSAESAEGPLDSHEAMNNRNPHSHHHRSYAMTGRKKRSYEFLLGLVKRNSSVIEVTAKDDEGNPTRSSGSDDAKASELLLELLVKIAENPQQWSNVHDLLQKIDKDVLKSKELLDTLKSKEPASQQVKTPKLPQQQQQQQQVHHSKAYPTNFAYHRVTGSPGKAYIAVSVIAPKPVAAAAAGAGIDEQTLEDELKELKPWTHSQNLQNMADLRSRWVIQDMHERTKSKQQQHP